MSTVADTIWDEIGVSVTGRFVKGYPQTGPSFDCAGEPGEPDSIEDLAVEGLTGVQYRWQDGERVEVKVDLLNGVDLKNPEIVKFLANLAEFVREQAEPALLTEAAEW